MTDKDYKAIGSFRPRLIFTEEEEKWLRDHALKDQESELERIQRMLDDLSLINNKALEVYSADMDVLSVYKAPYSNRYTLQFADRGELVEVSNGSVRNIDTWRTEQERIDGANRRFARIGSGCFPFMHICPICKETFMTSSSLLLEPHQYKIIDGKVAHSKCLSEGESGDNSRSN